jgi:hypothetical protein
MTKRSISKDTNSEKIYEELEEKLKKVDLSKIQLMLGRNGETVYQKSKKLSFEAKAKLAVIYTVFPVNILYYAVNFL